MNRLFAELISRQIEASKRLAASEAALAEERSTAGLREEFIAVLGHDLRNPVAAVKMLSRALLRGSEDGAAEARANLELISQAAEQMDANEGRSRGG